MDRDRGLRLDRGTDLRALRTLDPGAVDVSALPVEPVPGTVDGVGAQVGPATLTALRRAGFPATCTSAGS